MAFSYDSSALTEETAAGRRNLVRLLIGDTADTAAHPAIFQNEELDAFLALKGDNVYYAGAEACEAWARTASRLAKRMERDNLVDERHAIADLLKTAAALRESAAAGSAAGTIQTGTISSSDQQYWREMRRDWTRFDEDPHVA